MWNRAMSVGDDRRGDCAARAETGVRGRREPGGKPDGDLGVPRRRRELSQSPAGLLGVIAVGGVVGAEARYGAGLIWPHGPGSWPWATLLVNASGCGLIGVLMVLITEGVAPHPLVRPFLGVGVLGGYTTFSTATLDVLVLAHAGRLLLAAGYAVATPVLAVLACAGGVAVARRAARRWAHPTAGAGE
jgi:fluoride exporter